MHSQFSLFGLLVLGRQISCHTKLNNTQPRQPNSQAPGPRSRSTCFHHVMVMKFCPTARMGRTLPPLLENFTFWQAHPRAGSESNNAAIRYAEVFSRPIMLIAGSRRFYLVVCSMVSRECSGISRSGNTADLDVKLTTHELGNTSEY
jgi:hypothetical protein